MAETIRRNLMLKDYDIKEDEAGRQMVFSIKFCTKNGEVVFLPRAVASGLPFNVSESRMRGVVAIDDRGDRIGHVYPVGIDRILEWNNREVVL